MWKLFFEICDLMCYLIPSSKTQHKIRMERLYDWRRKYNALKQAFPELDFRHTKMIKGGWNIGFIVDKKYVFKIRKNFDEHLPIEKIMRESRITNAFANIVALRIPKVDIVHAGDYFFVKYDFIRGKNMNHMPLRTIIKYRDIWGEQIGQFIYQMHNATPSCLDNLRDERNGDGWNHNDICNNIIVDKKTMRVAGIIDWEYAGWGLLNTEITNTTAFSKRMRQSGIQDKIISTYKKLSETK